MNESAEPALRVAQWLGAHALPLFFVALVAVLLLAAVGWWALQRYTRPRSESRLPPLVFLLLRIGIGFALIVAGAAGFAELADELLEEEEMGRLDQALTDALRDSVPAAAVQVFAWLTRLGDVAVLTALAVVVAVVLVWRGRRWLALGWVIALAGNGLLNLTLKGVFERVRPVHDDGLVLADGFSFPSGHSSGSVVAYGMLAYVLTRFLPARWHLPVMLAAVALAFTVGSSRVFLRVHFASDVAAGFASGTAWLAVCLVSIRLTQWWREGRGKSGL